MIGPYRRHLPARLALMLLLAALLLPGSRLQADTLNYAGLVVRLGDQSVLTRCVAFSEAEISGIDLLQRSGLQLDISIDPALGSFVCMIEGEGCAAANCLCAFPPTYWRYWLRANEDWQAAPVGADSRVVQDGDVDGWTWGAGPTDQTDAPPLLAFTDICSVQTIIYLPIIQG